MSPCTFRSRLSIESEEGGTNLSLTSTARNDPQQLHRMTVYGTPAPSAPGKKTYSCVNAAIIDSMAWLFRVTAVPRRPWDPGP